MQDNDISLVIPTLSRSDILLNQLKFYKELKVGFQIHICESCKIINDSYRKELDFLSQYLDIHFFHKPDFNDLQANHFLINNCKTNYLAWVADDDFLIPDGIRRAREFLETNDDFRVAYGSAILINKDTISKDISKISLSPYWGEPSFTQESSLERISDFSENYFIPLFGVHRTKEIIEDYEPLLNITSKSMWEYLVNYNTIARGKAKYLDSPYLIRQEHTGRYLIPKEFVDALIEDNVGESIPRMQDHLKSLFKELVKLESESDSLSKKYLVSMLKEMSSLKSKYENSKNIKNGLKFLFSFFSRGYLKIKNVKFKKTDYVKNFNKYLKLILLLQGD